MWVAVLIAISVVQVDQTGRAEALQSMIASHPGDGRFVQSFPTYEDCMTFALEAYEKAREVIPDGDTLYVGCIKDDRSVEKA